MKAASARQSSWLGALPSPMKYCAVRRYYQARAAAREAKGTAEAKGTSRAERQRT